MFLKLAMLAVFFAVTVAIGIACRKSAVDVRGFVLGGRNVGPWLTAFAYGTSYFSAVVFVGYAGQFGWKYGIASTWIGIGNSLIGSALAWALLGRRTRILTQHLKSATMPEYFGRRFDSRGLKIAASLIIFIFLIPYTASLYNGLSRLFSMAFHMDYTVCIILMSVLTAVYVVAGGYLASAINDFIQGIIMLGGIIAVVAAVLRLNGGFSEAIRLLSLVPGEGTTQAGVFTSFFGPDPINLLGVVLLTSLGTWGLPQMVGKFYAVTDEDAIKKGTVISTIFAFVIAGGCYFLGGFARLYAGRIDLAADGYDAIIPAMISDLSPLLIGVVVILVLSASVSTLSSLVLTSASTLTLDFIKELFNRSMKQKTQLLLIRLMVVVFIVISGVLAVIQYRSNVTFIAQLMGVSWGALAGAFLAPFLYSLYGRWVSRSAVAVSFAFGVGMMLWNLLARSSLPVLLQSPLNCGAFTMLAGLLLVPAVSAVSRKLPSAFTENIFACYEQKVETTAKSSLGDR